ncbi:MAG: hypothetical protein HDKAJFGB_01788 [Anaerolineae bacterium]|nr:hypothetical protein [Anaerolineae bacterium]
MERAALPEPCRARMESARASKSKSAARVAASDNAANADALDARPAAAGKLLRDATRACVSIFAKPRTRAKCSLTRAQVLASAGAPSSSMRSWASALSNSTVVSVVSAPKFMESESFRGIRNFASRLPQYLIRAIFGCAMAVVFDMCLTQRIYVVKQFWFWNDKKQCSACDALVKLTRRARHCARARVLVESGHGRATPKGFQTAELARRVRAARFCGAKIWRVGEQT